jgi:hypothetical protein
MATKREAAPIADARIKQVFMPGELLGLGATTMDYKGYDIIYSMISTSGV